MIFFADYLTFAANKRNFCMIGILLSGSDLFKINILSPGIDEKCRLNILTAIFELQQYILTREVIIYLKRKVSINN